LVWLYELHGPTYPHRLSLVMKSHLLQHSRYKSTPHYSTGQEAGSESTYPGPSAGIVQDTQFMDRGRSSFGAPQSTLTPGGLGMPELR